MPHTTYKFAAEVLSGGKVEVTTPLPPGSRVEVLGRSGGKGSAWRWESLVPAQRIHGGSYIMSSNSDARAIPRSSATWLLINPQPARSPLHEGVSGHYRTEAAFRCAFRFAPGLIAGATLKVKPEQQFPKIELSPAPASRLIYPDFRSSSQPRGRIN